LSLALQGGGSHGAFTWGVLERLLEDERINIEAISGASAGAVNAVVLAHGFAAAGREGARQALQEFWHKVSVKSPFSFPPERSGLGTEGGDAPIGLKMFFSFARHFSPTQINPFDINPLRDILAGQIDFDQLRGNGKIKLFVAATHVSTGTAKIFSGQEISLDAVLASACLPTLHRAVEIDGEAYWDGGFTANPPLFPLLHQCRSCDLMLVLLNGSPRPDTPTTSEEIFARITDIGFNAALAAELQCIRLAKREAESGNGLGRLERRFRNLTMHLIDSPEFMSSLSSHSKFNTQESFIQALHLEGRNRAQAWLMEHAHQLGGRGAFSLSGLFR
jgi:NTE family protein